MCGGAAQPQELHVSPVREHTRAPISLLNLDGTLTDALIVLPAVHMHVFRHGSSTCVHIVMATYSRWSRETDEKDSLTRNYNYFNLVVHQICTLRVAAYVFPYFA
jgi:hypothetical protein